MSIKVLSRLAIASRLEAPFTDILETEIRTNLQHHGHYIGHLKVFAQYQQDTKTGFLVGEPKIEIQQNGRVMGRMEKVYQLYKRTPMKTTYDCSQKMVMIYNEGVVNKRSLSAGGELGAEKIIKGGVTLGAEVGQDRPAEIFRLQFTVEVTLDIRKRTLQASARM